MAARTLIVFLAVAGCAGSMSRPTALPFIEDSYGVAREEAARKKQLLVVEGWAPW
jgi:hypothetical protein